MTIDGLELGTEKTRILMELTWFVSEEHYQKLVVLNAKNGVLMTKNWLLYSGKAKDRCADELVC